MPTGVPWGHLLQQQHRWPFVWLIFLIPRGARVRILYHSKHAVRVTIGVAHAKKNIALARTCNELLLRLKCNFHVPAHLVVGHAGIAGNECADTATSLGMRRFISENNVPNFWSERCLFVQRLFEVPLCLTQIAERLHTFLVQLQLE